MTDNVGDDTPAQTPVPPPVPPVADGTAPQYAAGYGYAPMPAAARRSRFAVFGAVVALGLVALIVASALLVMGVGRSHVLTSTITFQAQSSSRYSITDAGMTTVVAILNERLHSEGVDATAEKQPPNQVVIRVYGGADAMSLADSVGATGLVEFILMPKATYGTVDYPDGEAIPADGSAIDPTLPAQFTGGDLDMNGTNAAADDFNDGYWKVNFAFSEAKASQFSTWTGQHINEYFAIAVDRVAASVPYIKSQISQGAGEISGQFTEAQARHLVAVMKSGALPYPLQVISVSSPQTASPR
jgi:preprotein translocase subunit SecD